MKNSLVLFCSGIIFCGLLQFLSAAESPKAPPAAPTVEFLQKELADAKAQIVQLGAAVRKLQEQRNSLAQQLLDAEVQKAANEAATAPAAPPVPAK